MATYALMASEHTVQVLSPTIVLEVVYATIETQPSGVIASIPVDKKVFDSGTANVLLGDYANNIELMMTQPGVIAGQGTQTIDANGLIVDEVTFVVEYVPPNSTSTAITADAVVPTGWLSEGGDPQIEQFILAKAEAIIAGVLANLQSAAGG